ncbi:hypothetical protein LA635_2483 [Erwinia amylovora LA635]|nr:hypothetical protein LA635_2483 [Erwinia amylovora LA635]CDK22845.1 hypothetical protein LA637_2485 [Erwinia amylovora LA637]
MDVSAAAREPQQPNKKNKTRTRALIFLTVLLVTIGIAYLAWWLLILSHYQETDDAYVAGNQAQVMA